MKSFPLYVMISLSGMVFGAEVVASHVTQSLVLLISAYHMLYNILSLLLLVMSHRMSKEKTLKNTFGWARVKVLGMMINMLFLCALCFAASVEAVQTVVHAAHENTEPSYPLLLLCLGIVNFVLNIICFVLIGGYTHHQGCSMIIQGNEIQVNYVLAESQLGQELCHNFDKKKEDLESCSEDLTTAKVSNDHKLLDLFRDTSSCLAVIACACLILLLNGLILKYVDAILAVASVVILVATTYPFIRESSLILLQSIPNNMDIHGLAKRLQKKFPDIQNVHDLHVWRLTVSQVIATVHVILSSPTVYSAIASELKEFFESEGISLVTIQPEFFKDSCSTKNGECILRCSANNNCAALTCCGLLADSSSTRLRCTAAHKKEENCEEELASVKKEKNSSFLEKPTWESQKSEDFDFQQIDVVTETTV